MKLPGFLTPLGILLGALALLLVLLLIAFGGQRLFSPGRLSEVSRTGKVLQTGAYQNIESHADLTGKCAACHVAPWSAQTLSSRCAACHTDVQKQLTDPNTLHGSQEANNCRECHVEHRGPQGILTVVDQLKVDHERFGFSLATHKINPQELPFACADCHTDSLARFAPTRCVECHTEQDAHFMDVHSEQYGTECRDCHDGSDTFSVGIFDHNLQPFPLIGKHAAVACADCHAGARALADFAQTSTECVDCHLKNNKHGPNVGTDCARCHTTDGWQTQIFDHNLASYRLTGAHTQVACADCHVGGVFKGTPTDCVTCHLKDEAHSLMLGTDCASCHTTEGWKSATFDHSKTGYVLTGAHQQVACTDCHINDIFVGTSQTCIGCHLKDDVHKTQAGTDCAACHTTDAWRPARLHIFPLDHGGGGAIACSTCHTEARSDTGAPNYKTYTCYNCHDPETIRKQHLFAQMMGTDITDCARCHPTGQKTMQMH